MPKWAVYKKKAVNIKWQKTNGTNNYLSTLVILSSGAVFIWDRRRLIRFMIRGLIRSGSMRGILLQSGRLRRIYRMMEGRRRWRGIRYSLPSMQRGHAVGNAFGSGIRCSRAGNWVRCSRSIWWMWSWRGFRGSLNADIRDQSLQFCRWASYATCLIRLKVEVRSWDQ